MLPEMLSASVVITQNATDCGQCDGSAQLVLSMPGNVDVHWLDAQGTALFIDTNVSGSLNLNSLCTGQYSISIYQSGVLTEQFFFSIDVPGLSAGVSAIGFACLNGANQNLFSLLNENPAAGGIWIDPVGNPVSAVFNPAFSQSGIYSYQVTSGGCTLQSTVQMTVNQNADPGISTTYLICENYLPFELISALFGQPDNGGIWFNSNFQVDDGIYDPASDNSAIYTYMIDNVPGCPAVFSTLFVQENQIPDSGEDASIMVCPTAIPFNLIDFLGGTPQANGQWYYNMIQPVGPVFNPAVSPPGVYRYQVNGSTPCPNSSSFLTIGFTDGISAGENAVATFCETDSSVDMWELLADVPDTGGTWSGPGGPLGNGIFNPGTMLPGNYTYTVEALGCQPETAILEIIVQQLPDAGSDIVMAVCESTQDLDLSLFIQGNSAVGSFLYNNVQISGIIENFSPGLYQYEFVVDGGLCPADMALLDLTVDPLLSPQGAVQLAVCDEGMAFELNSIGANLPANGNWIAENGDLLVNTSVMLSGSQDNFFFVVPSDNTCPDDSLGLTIEVFQPQFETAFLETSLCETAGQFDASELLSAEVLGAGQWQGGNSAMATLTEGLFSFTFEETPPLGSPCPASIIEIELLVDALTNAGADSELTVCANLGVIDLNSYLSVDAMTGGMWNLAGVEIDPMVNSSVLNDLQLQYNVQPNGACPGDVSLHAFDVDFGITFNPGPDIEVCPGYEPVQLGEIPQSGYNYFWFPDDRLDDPFSAQPFISLDNPDNLEVNVVYSVMITNGICTFNENLELLIHPQPQTELGPDHVICSGQTVSLTATGGVSYEWTVNGQFVQSGNAITLQPTGMMVAEVLVLNDFGCSVADSVTIQVLETPNAFFEVSPYEGCSPLPVSVENLSQNTVPVNFQWLVNGSLVSTEESFEILLQDPGEYDFTLIVTGENGCASIQESLSMVTVFGEPVAYFIYEPEAPDFWHTQVAFLNQSQDFVTATWTVDGADVGNATSLVYDFPDYEGISYEICLEVSNAFGCLSTYCDEVVIQGVPAVYVPNAFVPDGNGINDEFIPVMTGMSNEDYSLSIYNRWGQKIFYTEDVNEAWTGNAFDGSHFVQNEVYTWILKCKELKTGVQRDFNGFVTIIR